MTTWTTTEKDAVISMGRHLQKVHPQLSPKKLFVMSMQNALPGVRHLHSLRSLPRKRYQFFLDALGFAGNVEEVLQTPEPAPEPEPEPEPEQRVRIRWTPEERAAIITAAVPLFQQAPVISRKLLAVRAMRAALPPERHRNIHVQGSQDWDWIWEGAIAGAMQRARDEAEAKMKQDITVLCDQVEATVIPPYSAPEPVPVPQPVRVPVSDRDTWGLLQVLAGRFFNFLDQVDRVKEAQEQIATLGADVARVAVANAKVESLLVKVLDSLDPALLREPEPLPAPVVAETRPEVLHDLKDLGRPASKLRIAVLGCSQGLVNRILEECGQVAHVEVLHDTKQASRRGFKGYDRVLVTHFCGHQAVTSAVHDLGRDKIIRLEETSPAYIGIRVKAIAAAHAGRATGNGVH